MKKKLRPKGCHRTISGGHIPTTEQEGYTIEFYCSACGLIDDTMIFGKYLGFWQKKIDDTKTI